MIAFVSGAAVAPIPPGEEPSRCGRLRVRFSLPPPGRRSVRSCLPRRPTTAEVEERSPRPLGPDTVGPPRSGSTRLETLGATTGLARCQVARDFGYNGRRPTGEAWASLCPDAFSWLESNRAAP